jgi:hypothetical protein
VADTQIDFTDIFGIAAFSYCSAKETDFEICDKIAVLDAAGV